MGPCLCAELRDQSTAVLHTLTVTAALQTALLIACLLVFSPAIPLSGYQKAEYCRPADLPYPAQWVSTAYCIIGK